MEENRENMMMEEEAIVLVDEDGNEVSFELVANLEIDGTKYVLLAENEESDDVIPFIMEEDENGEIALRPVEDEDEFEKVAAAYDALFDEDECECGCGHHHED